MLVVNEAHSVGLENFRPEPQIESSRRARPVLPVEDSIELAEDWPHCPMQSARYLQLVVLYYIEALKARILALISRAWLRLGWVEAGIQRRSNCSSLVEVDPNINACFGVWGTGASRLGLGPPWAGVGGSVKT